MNTTHVSVRSFRAHALPAARARAGRPAARAAVACAAVLVAAAATAAAAAVDTNALAAVRAAEQARIDLINKVYDSVVLLYPEKRTGGGSGVIIDPCGLALSNHHVMKPIGEKGLAGMADGNLYEASLVGTDPGGDLALVQITGRDTFTAAPLGDTSGCRPGDWMLAMGNPFTLALNHQPTVTLGILSAINRYVPGEGGLLTYGRCLQIDTAINPGNSGGPLYDRHGRVVGINGRIATDLRGPVNLGFGYSIAAEQIKNFLGDLRAARICVHATLDAVFRDGPRGPACTMVGLNSPLRDHGLDEGDILLSLDGEAIHTANQLAGLITTYPANWPVDVRFFHETGERTARIRLPALPYKARALGKIGFAGTPGEVRDPYANTNACRRVLARWRKAAAAAAGGPAGWTITETLDGDGAAPLKAWTLYLGRDGRYRVRVADGDDAWACDGKTLYRVRDGRRQPADFETEPAWADARAWSLWAALQRTAPEAQPSGLLLVGGDRTGGERADRLRLTLPGGAAWSAWFRLFNDHGFLTGPLLKAAPDADADDNTPAWRLVYDDTGARTASPAPRRRLLVQGLEERALCRIRVTGIQPLASWPEP